MAGIERWTAVVPGQADRFTVTQSRDSFGEDAGGGQKGEMSAAGLPVTALLLKIVLSGFLPKSSQWVRFRLENRAVRAIFEKTHTSTSEGCRSQLSFIHKHLALVMQKAMGRNAFAPGEEKDPKARRIPATRSYDIPNKPLA